MKDQDLPVFFLPETENLDKPTLADIRNQLDAKHVLGRDQDMDRVVRQCKIASMTMEHFLGYIEEGDLIIAAGDRSDIIIASIVSLFSPNYRKLAGILLTGGFVPGPNVMRLLENMPLPVPVLSVDTDTYTTTVSVDSVPAVISPGDERKAALALGVFESNVDLSVLAERTEITASAAVTPVMFEYSLFERARTSRRRIVLPESGDERILRAAEILLRRNAVDLTLLGSADRILSDSTSLGLDLAGAVFIDPLESPWTEDFIRDLYELRKDNGITLDGAKDDEQHVLLRHHDGLQGSCRRDGLRSGSHYG